MLKNLYLKKGQTFIEQLTPPYLSQRYKNFSKPISVRKVHDCKKKVNKKQQNEKCPRQEEKKGDGKKSLLKLFLMTEFECEGIFLCCIIREFVINGL